VAAVVVSLMGYFSVFVAAFTTITALLIGAFNHMTSEKVRGLASDRPQAMRRRI